MATVGVVLSHWGRLLVGLQASSLEFYQSVEQGIERRGVPDTERTRVDYFEGGTFSAKREYLRIRRGRLVIDVCGARFGNGFFVSWWLGELRSGAALLAVIILGILVLTWLTFKAGFFIGFLFLFFGIPGILFLLVRHTPAELEGWDDPLLALPLVGPVYERLFRPQTYYKIDTSRMFQAAVHSAVLEVVNELIAAKGLRALSEREAEPIHRDVFRQ